MNDLDKPKLMFERHLTRTPDPQKWAGAEVLVLTACDSGYLGHAMALARSMDAFSGKQHLLIHVINPGESDIAKVGQLAATLTSVKLHISAESVVLPSMEDAPAYYASARFIRMAELLEGESPVPLFALDADALAVAPMELDFSDKPEAEICLRRRDLKGGPVEEHLRVAAGAVWTKNTTRAAAFMRAVADDLVQSFCTREAVWFVDQLTLLKHILAKSGGAHVRNLKTKFSDWTMSDNAVFWTGKGDRKYLDVRYLLVREAFDVDAFQRRLGNSLNASLAALIPLNRQGRVTKRMNQYLANSRELRVGIFMPRLDLPWKQGGMKAGGKAPVPSEDTVELRLWWKRFAMELARTLTDQGASTRIIEIPAWEITPERVDGEDLDLAFIPHRCDLDFGPTSTTRRFYMQEYFRQVFVIDKNGWSAASSIYPVNVEKLPASVLGAWDEYHAAFQSGALSSKFGQSKPASRTELQMHGQIPFEPFIFYPLQVPHDQSIRYFSDVDQDRALEAVYALAEQTGLKLVLKEHPANRASMKAYREKYASDPVLWSEANLHDLLRHASGIITINSGVGFEALLAGKPVVCLGRAEYDAAAHRAEPGDLLRAWSHALAEPEEDRMARYSRFVDWFLGRHAVDLTRPYTGRHVLERLVKEALADAQGRREATP